MSKDRLFFLSESDLESLTGITSDKVDQQRNFLRHNNIHYVLNKQGRIVVTAYWVNSSKKPKKVSEPPTTVSASLHRPNYSAMRRRHASR